MCVHNKNNSIVVASERKTKRILASHKPLTHRSTKIQKTPTSDCPQRRLTLLAPTTTTCFSISTCPLQRTPAQKQQAKNGAANQLRQRHACTRRSTHTNAGIMLSTNTEPTNTQAVSPASISLEHRELSDVSQTQPRCKTTTFSRHGTRK